MAWLKVAHRIFAFLPTSDNDRPSSVTAIEVEIFWDATVLGASFATIGDRNLD